MRLKDRGDRQDGSPRYCWHRWLEPVFIAFIIGPFIYYAYVINLKLRPIEYPDAFAYLWQDSFNIFYLTGRSLTQRMLYTIVGNKPRLIANLQLLGLLAAALTTYLTLRRPNVLCNAGLSLALLWAFSSYTMNVIAIGIAPEPVHIALFICFHILLFGHHAPRAHIALLPIGLLFVFSRSVAPYIALAEIALFLLVGGSAARNRLRGWISHLAVLSVAAATSILVSLAFDSSIEINVANNLFTRVFPHPPLTELFHQRYGMPLGPFIESCRGGNVNTMCVDGAPMVRIDWKSRNFVLAADRYGLTDWIRLRGRQSWIKYLLWDAPLQTVTELEKALPALASGQAIAAFISHYLNYTSLPDMPMKYQVLKGWVPAGKGFLGFDPLEEAQKLLAVLGFADLYRLVAFTITGLAVGLWIAPSRLLLFGANTLAASLVSLFVSFFGDGIEIERHVMPACILLTMGGLSYVAGVLHIILALGTAPDRRRATGPGKSLPSQPSSRTRA